MLPNSWGFNILTLTRGTQAHETSERGFNVMAWGTPKIGTGGLFLAWREWFDGGRDERRF